MTTHPECKNGCAYARDIGMAPQHSCGDVCQYAQASLQALRKSPAMKNAERRNEQREIVCEAVEQADYETWKEFSMGKD